MPRRCAGIGGIDEIERHTHPALARPKVGDGRGAVGPVALQRDDMIARNQPLDRWRLQRHTLIDETGHAPGGGKIDQHRMTGRTRRGNGAGRPGLPLAAGLRAGGRLQHQRRDAETGAVQEALGLWERADPLPAVLGDRAGDRMLFATDMGWIMGPWTLVGAGVTGTTIVFAEGAPDWPHDRLWRLVEEERVTILAWGLGGPPGELDPIRAGGHGVVIGRPLEQRERGVRVVGDEGDIETVERLPLEDEPSPQSMV